MSTWREHGHARCIVRFMSKTGCLRVRRSLLFALLSMAPCLPLAGCASVVPDERFPDVQRAVDERLGRRVLWDQGRPEDQQAKDAVQALLAGPLGPDDAVQIALFGNKALQATFEDLGVAQADVVAAGELRSVNAQVEYLLREALVQRGISTGAKGHGARRRPTR